MKIHNVETIKKKKTCHQATVTFKSKIGMGCKRLCRGLLYSTLEICLVTQEPEDLFETISQAMLNALDRDALSGMGVVVHVM